MAIAWTSAGHNPSFRGADRRSASPESISTAAMDHDRQGFWVPGSALARRPGTTGEIRTALGRGEVGEAVRPA
jgi:hypothetical protein